MKKSLLGVMLLSLFGIHGQAIEAPLKPGHPEHYTVVEQDTLWDISNRFLQSPWLWPEVWHANPQIKNPHLIYPGDVISLVYIDGKPNLMVSRRGDHGRTIKLSPKIRATPIAEAIPPIPLDVVSSFLRRSRIISDPNLLEQAPYVIATNQERLVSGAGEVVYARGQFNDALPAYGFYRKGEAYIDPKTGENLGMLLVDVGAGDVKSVSYDIATIKLTKTSEEVRIGDHLIESEERAVASNFYPKAPAQDIDGEILAVIGGVNNIGQYDNVLINRGQREGIQDGDILIINKQLIINDKIAKEKLELPAEPVGMMMVFRTFEKMSFGIVMHATQALAVGDTLSTP